MWVHQMSTVFSFKRAVILHSFYVTKLIQMPSLTVCFLSPQQWELMREYEGTEDTVFTDLSMALWLGTSWKDLKN